MRTTVNVKACARAALLFAVLLLSVFSVFVGIKHVWAEHVLDATDFQKRTTSGATFFAGPKRLFLHQHIGVTDITKHLQNVGFTESDNAEIPGTYLRRGKFEVTVTPRLPEFERLRVRIHGQRITGLGVALNGERDFRAINEASLEPEVLGSFVESLNGEDRSRMFVKRQIVAFDAIRDSHFFYALVASEDSLFLKHGGTRFDRLIPALLPGKRGGRSSLTDQTVKNAISLDWSHSFRRKMDEMFLASALEHRMDKERIITLYANDVFLGGGNGAPNIYGFAAAAAQYYGKHEIKSLTVSESAALVAMLPKPSYFVDRARNGEYDELRLARNRVLDRMAVVWPQRYTGSAIAAAKSEPLVFVAHSFQKTALDVLASAFVDIATEHEPLLQLKGLAPDQYAGLHLYTSIDPDLLRDAQQLLDTELPKIQAQYPPAGGGSCSVAHERLLGAIVAIDPTNGQIIVTAGSGGGKKGVEYAKLALNAEASPASSVKPMWLVLKLANNEPGTTSLITSATLVSTKRGPERIRTALAWSSDDLPRFLIDTIGADKAVTFLQALTGKRAEASPDMLALGFGRNTEVAPLTWARAYSLFPSGQMRELAPISAAYLDGRTVEQKEQSPLTIADPGAAFITTQMMRSVVGFGYDGIQGTARVAATSAGLRPNELALAGKTGSGPHAVWMMSVSPRLVVAVLLTYRCHSDIKAAGQLYAGQTTARIWSKFLAAVEKSRPDLLSGTFEAPANVHAVRIDPKRGCQSKARNSIVEYFLDGTIPDHCP
jgi:membrane peptidoglycan carboxypeptidase